MGSCHLQSEHLFCFSHCQIRWTMWVDDVSLNTYPLGTSNFMITLIKKKKILGVNQSGLETSSTSNQAIGRTSCP